MSLGNYIHFNYNSYKWILPELISKGLIYRRGYDTYSRNLSKVGAVYTPLYSENAKKIQQLIEEEYPLAEFCIFEINDSVDYICAILVGNLDVEVRCFTIP